MAAGRDDARAGDAVAGRAVGADGDDRRRAVAEQAAGDQVGDRVVVALDGERAELDRQQHGDLVGPAAQVVVQPGDAGRAGDAAEPEQRHPLHVGPQPQTLRDAGVDRGGGDAGHRRRDDQVDLVGPDAGRVERARDRRGRPSSEPTSMKASLAAPKSASFA